MAPLKRLTVTIPLLCFLVSGTAMAQSPSLWVLNGSGQVFALPAPTPLPEEVVYSLPGLPEDATPLVLVRIPGGRFSMGRQPDEQDGSSGEIPRHEVTIPADFYLGKFEVTKAQWQAVLGTRPWEGGRYVLDDPDSPAVYITWDDCQSFIAALNRLGRGTFRLPSEAEWEYACRAGTSTRFYWGDDPAYAQIGDYAWYFGNTWDAGETYAHRVGLKRPNAWGLHDLSGNVWEWCEDDWHDNYSGAPLSGEAWIDSPRGTERVLRGGYWRIYAGYCRSAFRYYSLPGNSFNSAGMRLVWHP